MRKRERKEKKMYWTGNAKYFSLVNKISNKVWRALESKSVTLEVTTYKPYNLHLVFQTHIVWHRHTAWGFLPPFYSKKKRKKENQSDSKKYLLITILSFLSLPLLSPYKTNHFTFIHNANKVLQFFLFYESIHFWQFLSSRSIYMKLEGASWQKCWIIS